RVLFRSPLTFDPACSSRVSVACTGPWMVPLTTICDACTSPSMRASADTARVPGWSATALTLPRIMPSTLNPPLKITLPSIRVVVPMRLSIRFCGLLDLLNISCSLRPYGQRVSCARLAGASLVDAHLHAFHLRLRVHPERPFDPTVVFESQAEGSRVRLLREAHHSIAPLFRQADDELEPSIELALAPRARGDKKQPVAVFARQYVRYHLEAVNGRCIAGARVRGDHGLECAQFLTQARIVLLERADLLGKLLLRGALDGEPAVGGIGYGAQPLELRARGVQLAADAAELLLHLAAVEAGKTPSGIVDPGRRNGGNAEQCRDPEPAPVPRQRAVNFDTRRGDAEAPPQRLGPVPLHGTTAS